MTESQTAQHTWLRDEFGPLCVSRAMVCYTIGSILQAKYPCPAESVMPKYN